MESFILLFVWLCVVKNLIQAILHSIHNPLQYRATEICEQNGPDGDYEDIIWNEDKWLIDGAHYIREEKRMEEPHIDA